MMKLQFRLEEIVPREFERLRVLHDIPELPPVNREGARRFFRINTKISYPFEQLVSEVKTVEAGLYCVWLTDSAMSYGSAVFATQKQWDEYRKRLLAESNQHNTFLVDIHQARRKGAKVWDRWEFEKRPDGQWLLFYFNILATHFKYYDLQFWNLINPLILTAQQPDNPLACREIIGIYPVKL